MKILHYIEQLDDGNGMAVFCRGLLEAETQLGHEVRIATRTDWPLVGKWDVVHIHNPWLWSSHRVTEWAKQSGVRIVRSAHGAFNPWSLAYHRWRKCLAWKLYVRRDFAAADVVHVTSRQEAVCCNAMGIPDGKIIVAPPGVAVDDRAPPLDNVTGRRTLLYLGRLHPVKGLDLLIEAWGKVRAENWRLVIAGPDERGTLAQLKAQVRRMGYEVRGKRYEVRGMRYEVECGGRVEFRGPVYGEEKQKLLAACDVFVLPSRSENFGLVVAEALAAGKPVVCTKAAPWSGLDEVRGERYEVRGKGCGDGSHTSDHGPHTSKCGWWVDVSADGLAAALREAMTTPPAELAAMGARGRDWMKRDFSWRICAKTLLATVKPAPPFS